MPVTFRFARADEYAQISRFIDEFWAKDHIYVRNKPLFDWTFHRTTHWPEDQYSFSLSEDGGELTGILGGIPFTFNNFGKTSHGVWIVNYVVRPDHRKGTAALQLLSTFRRPEFDPVIAFGINPATSAIYRVLRGRVLPQIPRSLLLLPEARDRFSKLLQIAYPEAASSDAENLTEFFARPLQYEIPVNATTDIPAAWDECDWPTIASSTVGVARDAEFLRWRYQQHPCFEYRFLVVAEGRRHGLLVWRLETIRKQTESGRADVDRIGRLVEFLPTSEANAEKLVAALVGELRKHGAFGADYYGFHGATRRSLCGLGFVPIGSHPDGEKIPTRFQPLDGKGGGILSAMFLTAPLPECTDAVDCPWYWTKADSDQDRPN